jgi:hypothetical protein
LWIDTELEIAAVPSRPNWGAIGGGALTFLAIWAVFGTIGFGIFTVSANPKAAAHETGTNAGIAARFVIVTVISMFVAG